MRAPSRALGIVRAVPTWVWLGGLVVVSAGVRYALARRLVAPWIMVDEVIYSELAKSFAATGHFLLRGNSTGAYGIVYPTLISPAWAAFSKVPQAYAAAKAINSIAISLTAVPAYLLARRVLTRPYALAAAVLALAIPTTLYAGMLMTENAFYPAFVLAALATVLWLEQPTWRRTVLVAAAAVLAFLTRAEAVAIAPALVTAPFLVSGRRALREFRGFFALAAGVAAIVIGVQAARGASPLGLLGAYEVASHTSYSAGGIAKWLVYHWGDLVLSLGVVPFAALVLLLPGINTRPRNERAFLAAASTLSFWLVLEVATFASEQSLRIEERNMVYVAPLFLTALLLWVQRGAPRPRLAGLVAGALAVGLLATVPFATYTPNPRYVQEISDAPSLVALSSLVGNGVALGDLRLLVILAGAAATVLFLLVPRRYAIVLPLLVFAYFGFSQKPIERVYRQTSINDLFGGITVARDWIDRKVGHDARVAVIWSGNAGQYSIWENEFFNRSLRDFYYTQEPLAGDLPEKKLSIDRATGLMSADGRPVRATYVLTDGSVALNGHVIATDGRKGMLLYRVGGPLQQLSRVDGLYPQDTWSGPEATYTRLDCRGGNVTVTLQSDPALFMSPQTVVAYVGVNEVARVVVAPREIRSLTVPLRPSGGTCVARFRVTPTAIPNVVTHGVNPDPRLLGIHFNAFSYKP
jgi:Dolichyl-phosphate-mannose-protein mannosyltransferase